MTAQATPQDVIALRERIQATLGIGITAAQDWCAEAVCSQRRAWQQWERGERSIHRGIYKLACIEVSRAAHISTDQSRITNAQKKGYPDFGVE